MLHLQIIFDSEIGGSKSNTKKIKKSIGYKKGTSMSEDWKPLFVYPNMKQNPGFFSHPIKVLDLTKKACSN